MIEFEWKDRIFLDGDDYIIRRKTAESDHARWDLLCAMGSGIRELEGYEYAGPFRFRKARDPVEEHLDQAERLVMDGHFVDDATSLFMHILGAIKKIDKKVEEGDD